MILEKKKKWQVVIIVENLFFRHLVVDQELTERDGFGEKKIEIQALRVKKSEGESLDI